MCNMVKHQCGRWLVVKFVMVLVTILFSFLIGRVSNIMIWRQASRGHLTKIVVFIRYIILFSDGFVFCRWWNFSGYFNMYTLQSVSLLL